MPRRIFQGRRPSGSSGEGEMEDREDLPGGEDLCRSSGEVGWWTVLAQMTWQLLMWSLTVIAGCRCSPVVCILFCTSVFLFTCAVLLIVNYRWSCGCWTGLNLASMEFCFSSILIYQVNISGCRCCDSMWPRLPLCETYVEVAFFLGL